jgi:hypothetical protein
MRRLTLLLSAIALAACGSAGEPKFTFLARGEPIAFA